MHLPRCWHVYFYMNVGMNKMFPSWRQLMNLNVTKMKEICVLTFLVSCITNITYFNFWMSTSSLVHGSAMMYLCNIWCAQYNWCSHYKLGKHYFLFIQSAWQNNYLHEWWKIQFKYIDQYIEKCCFFVFPSSCHAHV